MKIFKKILMLALSFMLVCGCAVKVSAEASIYDNAISTMKNEWNGIGMTVETSEDGVDLLPYTLIYQDGVVLLSYAELVEDSDGNLVLPESTTPADNVFFTDLGSEDASVITYSADIAPLPDGWYSYDANSYDFYINYNPIVDYAFLDSSFSDSDFDIKTDGGETVLVAKESIVNEIAYKFFGDFSDEYASDVFTFFSITIENGTIETIIAENVYGNGEYIYNYTYTINFYEGDFIFPEYSEFINVFEVPDTMEVLPVGTSVENIPVEGVCYTFTPARNTTLRFTSTEDEGMDPCVYIMTPYSEGYGELVDTIDDEAADDYTFNETYFFKGGQTYYISIFDYNEIGGFSTVIEEFFFRGSDINGDGKISPLDASLVLRYNAKLIEFTEEQVAAADANGDGRVSPLDASLFLQYDAKLIFAEGE